MAHLTLTKKERALLISIIFITPAPLILKHYITLPDGIHGVLVGIGLGLWIVFVVGLQKSKTMKKK